MRVRYSPKYLLAIPILLGLVVLVYNIPFVHSRLEWRLDALRVRIQYAVNPPEQAVFQPQEQAVLENQVKAIVNATLTPLAPTLTYTPTLTTTLLTSTPTQPGPTATPIPSATPTLTPTSLPASFRLAGAQFEGPHNRYT